MPQPAVGQLRLWKNTFVYKGVFLVIGIRFKEDASRFDCYEYTILQDGIVRKIMGLVRDRSILLENMAQIDIIEPWQERKV
jgi:hypothetical protein